MCTCHIRIPTFGFEKKQIDEALAGGRLLSMEMEGGRRCNFKCPHCYIPYLSESDSTKDDLTGDEIHDVIMQARDLGARRIILLGGEPMMVPEIFETIRFIRSLDLEVELFTNGWNITPDNARRLFDLKVNIALRMSSRHEETQDRLTGVKGAYQLIHTALHALKSAGYPSDDPFLAICAILCRQNANEAVEFWRWVREEGMIPYFAAAMARRNTADTDRLHVEPERLLNLFEEICEIDRTLYGQDWDPQPPLVGNACRRHGFSCLVTSKGDVLPCMGISIPVGDIRQKKLAEIIEDSEIIQDLQKYHSRIKGPCSTCGQSDVCYGCRGTAYNLTGDFMASDPMCWRNSERRDAIESLPMSVEDFIPQKGPMRLIDTLLSVGERCAQVSVDVTQDMPFVHDDGSLDESVYLEMIAQSIAAMNGFKQRERNTEPEGLLVGAKNLTMPGNAGVGDTLRINVFKAAKFGDLAIIRGTVRRNEEIIAEGEIKIWHKNLS
ncbi:radical SAM protein [Thermodesulfobacteriota bacterium]